MASLRGSRAFDLAVNAASISFASPEESLFLALRKPTARKLRSARVLQLSMSASNLPQVIAGSEIVAAVPGMEPPLLGPVGWIAGGGRMFGKQAFRSQYGRVRR